MRIRIIKGASNILHFFIAIWLLTGGMRPHAYGREMPVSGNTAPAMAHVLTLDQVIDLALSANRTILGSEYGITSQRYGLEIAESEFEWKYAPTTGLSTSSEESRIGAGVALERKSRFGPKVRVTPELVRRDIPGEPAEISGQVDVGLTIPLLKGWGREVNQSSVDAALYASRSLRRSHYLTKVNIVLDAVTAAYAIAEQKELVALNRLQTKNFQTHAIVAAAKEKIGLATPMDIYRAQIRLKDFQDRLNRANEALQNARDRLKLILSIPLAESLAVSVPMEYHSLDISVEQAVSSALKFRVELLQSADEIDHLESAARVSRDNLKPQLDLVGRYNHLGLEDSLARGIGPEEDYWSVSLVSASDWRRTAEKAEHQRSLLAIKAAKLNRWTVNDNIQRQVRQTYDALLKAEERIEIRNEQIRQAKGKLALAQVKFNHDMADNFDVIEAETELQAAQSNLLAAQIEQIVGRYRLRAAMGTLIAYNKEDPPDQDRLNAGDEKPFKIR